jgi:hypothetical protein
MREPSRVARSGAKAAGDAGAVELPDDWPSWPDERLLDVRMCDLANRIAIKGSALEERTRALHRELRARGLRFRPYFWLSDDWFTPDGVPGIAIPFYVAHPRLTRLETSQMYEAEGATPEWCMRILRHETGHAIENAYRLRRRQPRIALFGRSSQPYPKFYTPRPYSRSYVLHLEAWYAQSHPDEDFAETFAVWLTPGSMWQKRYAGWPALKKLQYVDETMRAIGATPSLVQSRRRLEPLTRMRKTLREHYLDKRRYYGVDTPDIYDRDLRRLFSDAPECRRNLSAVRFIARVRRDVRRVVARWTGVYQYTVKQVIDHISERCRVLNLRLAGPEDQAKVEFTVFLAVQTMNYLHSGQHRVWL